jgi:hypothetical protein
VKEIIVEIKIWFWIMSAVKEAEIAMVKKVREFFEKEKNEGVVPNLNQVTKRTAAATGLSERTVHRYTKEEFTPKEYESNSMKIVLTEQEVARIRTTIFDFYQRKEFPTLDTILEKLKEDSEFKRQISRSTLYKNLLGMNFCFKNFNKRTILMENDDMTAMRAKYLRDIKFYRKHGWTIWFVDETWANEGLTVENGWVELLNENDSTSPPPGNLTRFVYRASL